MHIFMYYAADTAARVVQSIREHATVYRKSTAHSQPLCGASSSYLMLDPELNQSQGSRLFLSTPDCSCASKKLQKECDGASHSASGCIVD